MKKEVIIGVLLVAFCLYGGTGLADTTTTEAETKIEETKGLKVFDGTQYSKITFWVKGEKGGETFRIGIADMHWDKLQDSVKSGDVTDYLVSGQVSTDWQKVEIPLDTWFVDIKQLASFAVCFESDNYPEGEQAGTVFIDDVQFE